MAHQIYSTHSTRHALCSVCISTKTGNKHACLHARKAIVAESNVTTTRTQHTQTFYAAIDIPSYLRPAALYRARARPRLCLVRGKEHSCECVCVCMLYMSILSSFMLCSVASLRCSSETTIFVCCSWNMETHHLSTQTIHAYTNPRLPFYQP